MSEELRDYDPEDLLTGPEAVEHDRWIEEEEWKLNKIREIYDELDDIGIRVWSLKEDDNIKESDFNIINFLLCRVMEILEKYL